MYPALTVADLDVLQNVRVVTQYVNIQLGNSERSPGPRSLSFLRNLETIDGRLKFE